MTTKTAPAAPATFARDIEGGWGLRVPAQDAAVGAAVTVTRRDGTTKALTITEVWAEDTDRAGRVWCRFTETTRPAAARPTRTSRPASGGHCDNCGQSTRSLTPAVDSSGIGGMVCRSCSRESRWELSFA